MNPRNSVFNPPKKSSNPCAFSMLLAIFCRASAVWPSSSWKKRVSAAKALLKASQNLTRKDWDQLGLVTNGAIFHRASVVAAHFGCLQTVSIQAIQSVSLQILQGFQCWKASWNGRKFPRGLCLRRALWSSTMQNVTCLRFTLHSSSLKSRATSSGGFPKAPHPNAENTQASHFDIVAPCSSAWIFLLMRSSSLGSYFNSIVSSGPWMLLDFVSKNGKTSHPKSTLEHLVGLCWADMRTCDLKQSLATWWSCTWEECDLTHVLGFKDRISSLLTAT